jgi:hypothetical protein
MRFLQRRRLQWEHEQRSKGVAAQLRRMQTHLSALLEVDNRVDLDLEALGDRHEALLETRS